MLEDAGYVEVRKGAVGRRPRTWFRLTAAGRQAVQGHLAWLAQLEQAVSASTRDAQQARPLPGNRDQPRRELPPLLGSTWAGSDLPGQPGDRLTRGRTRGDRAA